jgi:FkbM family methyltransferase
MYTLLRAYRWLLNRSFLPSFLMYGLERIGSWLHRSLFSGKHGRFQYYHVSPARGVGFTMTLDWHDYHDAGYLFSKAYAQRNTRFLLSTMMPGDVFLDVGANVGYFSLLVAALQRDMRVVSVEPLSRNAWSLQESIRVNAFSNITLCRTAVGSEIGEAVLEHRLLDSGSPSIVGYFGAHPTFEYAQVKELVPVTTIPLVLSSYNIATCRCMKLDIQGAEKDALIPCSDLLKSRAIEYLIVEHNGSRYGDEVRLFLEGHGYLPYRIGDSGELIALSSSEGLRNKADYVFTAL